MKPTHDELSTEPILENEATDPSEKLAYHQPQLRDYGQFRDLTRATFSGVGAADNVIYAS